MAGVRAIMAVSQSIISVLRNSYNAEQFDTELDFAVFSTEDYEIRRLRHGISLYLHQVTAFSTLPETAKLASQHHTPLPLELHFMLTVWVDDTALRQKLARWMVRTLNQSALLTASALNAIDEGAFRNDEAFELCLGDLKDRGKPGTESKTGAHRWSVPYIARMVRLEASALRQQYA